MRSQLASSDHIVPQEDGIAAFGANAGGNLFAQLLVDIAPDHMRTFAGKNAHDGRSHALGGARNDGDSVLNAAHQPAFFLRSVEKSRLTGVFRSNGELSPNSLPISRTAGSTS